MRLRLMLIKIISGNVPVALNTDNPKTGQCGLINGKEMIYNGTFFEEIKRPIQKTWIGLNLIHKNFFLK